MTWPADEWPAVAPAAHGMRAAELAEAAAFALQHGGGSGCVLRGGQLVYEWGPPAQLFDVKSCTKGTLGTTLLGVALREGLVSLDDRAREHYPELGTEHAENRGNPWLDAITIRHLATMTAGFDDGRPPRLIYEPGTDNQYSNDTANMLAELLTLRFGEDLQEVFRREVAEPLGMAPESWAWRENVYRAKTVGGLPSREFASGLTVTPRALARIGCLYLHDGRWGDRQLLPAGFVREATEPVYNYYGFYWGTNGHHALRGVPARTFWALGLGDSFVAVSPPLDLVVVRLGVGSTESQLDDASWWNETSWGERVTDFVRRVMNALEPPYPSSPVISGAAWAPAEQILRLAKGKKGDGSDNWPITWADDDGQYTAYGDGYGFDPIVDRKLSMGFARVRGNPPEVVGENIRSESGEALGGGRKGKKASGMLMVDGVLYMLVRNAGNAQLAWSPDRSQTWEWAQWRFTTSFGYPTFLNFGPNYTGARDEYVYVYSHDADSAYHSADRMVLARVPKDRIRERDAYRFFVAVDADGQPQWSRDVGERGAVFVHPGRCYRSGITYNPGLDRYLWCQVIPAGDTRFHGGFGIYDAPEPWGPWSCVFHTPAWDVGPGEASRFPTRWMSEDGVTCHLLFSGDDNFSTRRVTFIPHADEE